MSNVTRLRPNRPTASNATLAEIEATFARLADKHGAWPVMTVAVSLLATTLERVAARGRPNEMLWAEDLQKRLESALATTRRAK